MRVQVRVQVRVQGQVRLEGVGTGLEVFLGTVRYGLIRTSVRVALKCLREGVSGE